MPDKLLLKRYRFNNCMVDLGSRRVVCGGVALELTPKEFQTLLLLVEAAPQAVEREQMVRKIWPDTVVGDTSLGRNISVLRRHLGAETIKSIAKYGYRLVPEVTVLEAESAVLPAPAVSMPGTMVRVARPQWTLRALIGLVSLVSLALVALAVSLVHRRVYGTGVNPEAVVAAARWDDMGVFALREGTYFKAARAFQQAVRMNPHSAMAHAHLAEADLELEQLDQAGQEILIASGRTPMRDLTEQEQRYVDAVRATIVRDYATATHEYESILEALPEAEKSNGLEDVGRAYKREGRIAESFASYERAAQLEPANAGVQLHLGILMGLRHDQSAALSFLDRAKALYMTSTNMEGVAQVTYQRGLMAYVRADYATAEDQVTEALGLAKQIDNRQLEALCYGSLSTFDRWDGKLAESADNANRMIAMSNEAQWDLGAAEGVNLLANVALARRDVTASRQLVTQSLALAQKLKNPRFIANAEFSTADLYGHTGDYAEEGTFARRSMEHYRAYGSVDGVADAMRLVIEAETGLGNLQQAMADAQASLASSERTHSDLFAEDTEEQIGDIYGEMGEYPTALMHYQRAVELSRRTGSEQALKSLDVAGCLARMGQVAQAAAMLKALSPKALADLDASEKYDEVRVAIQYGEGHYADAEALARAAAGRALAPSAAVPFRQVIVTAEAHLGQKAQALLDAGDLLATAQSSNNECRLAHARLTGAMIALGSQAPAQARVMAEAASQFFSGRQMRDSEWLALLYEAEAMHALGDNAGAVAKADGARRILAELEKQWPAGAYRSYVQRPDVHRQVQALATLRA